MTNLIKHLLIILVALMPALPALAQDTEQEGRELTQRIISANDAYAKAYKAKDYPEAIRQLTGMITLLKDRKTPPGSSQDECERIEYNTKLLLVNFYYNMACTYSLWGKKRQAANAFKQAIDYGWKNYRHTLEDTDFDNVRTYKPFQRLTESIRQYDHLEILKKAAPYRKESHDSLPKFKYMNSDTQPMKAVRAYFNTDSVAGNGDERSRILNLMHFVHNQVSHDGGHRPYCEFDAIDLYNYAKAARRGINCRCMAIMLCELYLAAGIPARYVTCMPADPDDDDCHVICAVWSRQQKKWLWMDPTFDAYVSDDNGNLLGIDEVRQRLINGLPLTLNEDANWNHQDKQTKEYYLENYMAKNLYWLECAVDNRFNTESPFHDTRVEYVNLVPTGFASKAVKGKYRTSDPEYFWQAPE